MVINELISNEINDRVDTSVVITDFSNVNGNFYFNLKCDRWLPLSGRIVIDNVLYHVGVSEVVGFKHSIRGITLTPITSNLQKFFFYEGTPKDVTQVFQSAGAVAEDKLPIVWLSFAPIPTITDSGDSLSPHPVKLDFTMFFCGSTNYVNRNTKEHMSEVVKYLDVYVNAFVKAMDGNYVFKDRATTTKKQYPIFGSLDKNGFTKNIIDGTMLSAIELKISVFTEIECYC